MGQELIKSAVDATVFVINLTSALIKFVMTAALVPVCHQTHNKGERREKGTGGAVNVRDSSSQQISQWSTANIHHNPSIKSQGDGVVAGGELFSHEKAASLLGVWQESPFKRRGFAP